MIEFGEYALQISLFVTAFGGLMAVAALVTRRSAPLVSAVRCLHVNALCVALATLVLVLAFVEGPGVPMTLKYVAQNSSRDMPGFYKVAALWGGMSGSLLFWAFLLTLFSTLAFLGRDLRKEIGFQAGTALTLLGVQGFFLYLLSQVEATLPFERLPSPVADGRGLNPLLQHPGMAIHPPLLYIGFVSMTIPFAYAMGALISGRLGTQWIRVCRTWTLMGWTVLTAGITLGGIWAYLELGWGGYWAWDPVENASFMPWLVMTAFLHSVMIQEHRGMLKTWNMVLILLTFLMTIFGTFLTRSGFLASVHTFAQNAELNKVFASFMIGVALVGLVLIIVRRKALASENKMESFLSREFAFLANNVVLLALMVTILIGTLLPPLTKLLTDREYSVGPPWFNARTVPLWLLLILLTGYGPLVAWRKASARNLRRNFFWPAAAGLAAGAGVAVWLLAKGLLTASLGPWAAVGFVAAGTFAIGTLVVELVRGTAARRGAFDEGRLVALLRLCQSNRRRYGGYLCHLGVIVAMFGITCSSVFRVEIERTLTPGQSMSAGAYTLTYEGSYELRRPEYSAVRHRLSVSSGGQPMGELRPENRFFFASQQNTSEVRLQRLISGDLYVVNVATAREGRGATFLVFWNPLIGLVWLGVLLMCAGGVYAGWPGKRQARVRRGRRLDLDPADLRIPA